MLRHSVLLWSLQTEVLHGISFQLAKRLLLLMIYKDLICAGIFVVICHERFLGRENVRVASMSGSAACELNAKTALTIGPWRSVSPTETGSLERRSAELMSA